LATDSIPRQVNFGEIRKQQLEETPKTRRAAMQPVAGFFLIGVMAK
jgi:hypothetical protein